MFLPSLAKAQDLNSQVRGKILLQVETKGEAWYVNPDNNERYYLGRPADAFKLMRELGVGISNADYNKFQAKAPVRLAGKILLRVESNGEAYYVNPVDLKPYYLGRPTDAFNLMRQLGLGISNKNLEQIRIRAGYEIKIQESKPTTATATPEICTSTEDVIITPETNDTSATSTEEVATSTETILPACTFNAEYFKNMTLTGFPVLTQNEKSINYEWWTGKPSGFNYNNEFSVRWTSQCEFLAGDYIFTATYDDGMRVYLDDQLIIDDWQKRFETKTTSVEKTLTGATHKIVVEYFEYSQIATAKFSWTKK